MAGFLADEPFEKEIEQNQQDKGNSAGAPIYKANSDERSEPNVSAPQLNFLPKVHLFASRQSFDMTRDRKLELQIARQNRVIEELRMTINNMHDFIRNMRHHD
jgi:hypothetical protein